MIKVGYIKSDVLQKQSQNPTKPIFIKSTFKILHRLILLLPVGVKHVVALGVLLLRLTVAEML